MTRLYLVLQACSEKLRADKRRASSPACSLRWRKCRRASPLSCIKVSAIRQDFDASILGAWQVLGQEKRLTRLPNHVTDTLNSSVSGNKRPTCLGRTATTAHGQLLHWRGPLARPAAAKSTIESLLSSVYSNLRKSSLRGNWKLPYRVD